MNVYSDISNIKGVGPKIRELLNKCGIFYIIDLLLYFPRDYEQASVINDINECSEGEKVIVKCRFIRGENSFRSKTGKVITKLVFTTGSQLFYGTWFNMPYAAKKFQVNKEYLLIGKVNRIKGEITLNSPVTAENNADTENKLLPIYPLKENLKNTYLIKLINGVLENIKIEENLPEWVLKKQNYYSLDKAIRCIHNPKNYEELNQAKKRLKFQELFNYSLKTLMLKEFVNKHGIAYKIAPELTILKDSLPYSLTNAQNKAVREILIDEKKPTAMNRLLQGDVGSGKTIVALIALFNVIKNGYQGVMLAPTEILANQHFYEAEKLFKDFDVSIALLTGSVTTKKKITIKEALKQGEVQLVIGTHALLEDDVEFNNLGMVVTDEQHRFGVMQRTKLYNKGNNIDVLVMTATPIPRTLGLYLYGDLDISVIDELPPGRKKIETHYANKRDSEEVYKFALEQIKAGRQVYVVCPLVEENEELSLSSVEKLLEKLKAFFSPYNVQMIHGKMPAKDKNNVMEKFKNGEINVLVATTVIEVGVNVPNASVMIIENAERFGLAQLHQLRGRVGRGNYKSYCMLIAEIKSKTVKHRLEVLKNSNDGFYIAEEDLKLRGSGEVFGFRQHGEDGLILSDLIEDCDILKEANREAKLLIKSQNGNDIIIKKHIYTKLQLSTKFICFN